MADFNLKIAANMQNKNMEAGNKADGTSDYENTSNCWNVDQVFYLYKNTICTIEGPFHLHTFLVLKYVCIQCRYLP